MDKLELQKLSDSELCVLKKKHNQSKIFHAVAIGFLVGILIFGFVSWFLSSHRNFGFLVGMIIPIVMIRRIVKDRSKDRVLDEVLRERGLN